MTRVAQTQYITKVLERFGMQDSHPVKTPLDFNVKLEKTPEGERHHLPEYQNLIGSLMYTAINTRPDIAFAVQHLSQFLSNPLPVHWTAAKRVLRYLNGTRDLGIVYGMEEDFDPIGYCDADWASNLIDRCSISGYIFLIGGGPISWQSKKQQTTALSTMEAEYMAASLATCKAVWLRNFYREIGSPQDIPTSLNIDNRSAIDFSNNSGFHARSKHIDIRHHFVHEKIILEDIEVFHCKSEDNIADVLTKALATPAHVRACALLNMGTDAKFRGSVGNKQY
jgi:hypothetical protein